MRPVMQDKIMHGKARSSELNMVLPRLLRRPARYLNRLVRGHVEYPRHSFGVMAAGLFCVTGLYGMIIGGHVPIVVSTLASNTGFAISEIEIEGNTETSEIDVMGAIGLNGWTALPGFSPEAARERIAGLPWVQQASVQKVYPSTLQVKLSERKPFAIWQRGEVLTVIEQNGEIIAPYVNAKFAGLPLVVGEGAARKAQMFIAGMARFPAISGRVKGYVRIADRRWDIILDNGVTVKLPESGELAAVQRLEMLETSKGLLERDIVTIDMRLKERMTVRLSKNAAAMRSERMNKLVKAEKARGRI